MGSTLIIAFVGVLGMMACLFFAVRPLWPSPGARSKGWRASTVWSDWLDRRQTLLFNLEDLAHEQRLGKISAQDYSRLQTAYKKELVALMDQMEASEPPVDFQNFMLTPSPRPLPQGGEGKGETVCFQCKAFYQANFSFCPQCGGQLTVRS